MNGEGFHLGRPSDHPLHSPIMRFYRQAIYHLKWEADRHCHGLRVLWQEGVVVASTVAKSITLCSEREAGNKDHVEGAGVWFIACRMACAEDAW